MNSLLVLLIILAVLMIAVAGRAGLRNLLGLAFNLLTIFVFVTLVSWQLPILPTLAVASLMILALSIFMSSDDAQVTYRAFRASLIVAVALIAATALIQHIGQFQGFASEDNEELENLSLAVGLDFGQIALSVMTLSALGAVAEAAMAVSADLAEIIRREPAISLDALSSERQVLSQQILGTAVNTLFFGVLGSSVGLILWMVRLKYSLAALLNSKLLMADAATMLLGMLGVLLVIWLTGHEVLASRQKK